MLYQINFLTNMIDKAKNFGNSVIEKATAALDLITGIDITMVIMGILIAFIFIFFGFFIFGIFLLFIKGLATTGIRVWLKNYIKRKIKEKYKTNKQNRERVLQKQLYQQKREEIEGRN